MGNRLIFLYLVLLRRGDGEGYVGRANLGYEFPRPPWRPGACDVGPNSQDEGQERQEAKTEDCQEDKRPET